ncbi:TetR family transcriptional regulator [Streptomyces jumonjinensis]|uniref:TetR family transcriptional regulator n=1 Tax=Streptomyces jumonjinensis TaxID=1945 RepID=UPI0037B6F91B
MKQDRSRRTRERILDEAAAEFTTNGYTHTTVQDIARRVGMTKGALYGQFDSKEAVADALKSHGLAKVEGLRALAREDDPLSALGRFIVGLAQCLHDDVRLRAAFRLLADEAEAQLPGHPLSEVVEQVVGLVDHARRDGLISAGHDPADVARLLLCVAFAVQTTPFTAGGERHPRAWAEWAWSCVSQSLREAPA